jgi:hypothetical protein
MRGCDLAGHWSVAHGRCPRTGMPPIALLTTTSSPLRSHRAARRRSAVSAWGSRYTSRASSNHAGPRPATYWTMVGPFSYLASASVVGSVSAENAMRRSRRIARVAAVFPILVHAVRNRALAHPMKKCRMCGCCAARYITWRMQGSKNLRCRWTWRGTQPGFVERLMAWPRCAHRHNGTPVSSAWG